ncbi:MAG: DUF1573 domain-containing protein [Planctomycetaceae bacterium]|jgi:hypothetical protein|nr:DUF1573 domain-containing protein [Planctomycetaceae bacterium]
MRHNRLFLLIFAFLTSFAACVLLFCSALEQKKHTSLISSPKILKTTWESLPPASQGLTTNNNPLDLGDIKQGKHNSTFQLYNQTDQPIKIFEISKSCSCTEIKLSHDLIPPSQSGKIDFQWNTLGIRGEHSANLIVFYTVGDKTPSECLQLFWKGNVQPQYDFTPHEVVFDQQQVQPQTIRLVSREGAPVIRITDIYCAAPYIHKEIISPTEISVLFVPDQWVDLSYNYRTILEIYTDLPEEPHYKFPLVIKSYNQDN